MNSINEAKKIQELFEVIRDLEKKTFIEYANSNNKLEQIQKDQQSLKEEIEKLFTLINDPNEGFYKKFNEVVYEVKNLIEDQNECIDNLHDLKEEVNQIGIVKQNLIKIAGDRLEILDSTIKISQNSKKILWTFILAATSLAGGKIIEILKLF
jgi:NTP pyrophosphatase (non-canonical NTP hydrolase)